MQSKAKHKKLTKKQRVGEFARGRGWLGVAGAEWALLRAGLPDVAAETLRAGLREAGIPVEQPWRGVEQHTFGELADSLVAMSAVYAGGDEGLRKLARREVIAAKDRAKFASLSGRVSVEKRAVKAEMVEWMLVWLGDPALFPAWVELRLKRADSNPG